MILTCPECATSYFVDDSKIGPDGRSVRCASCGTRWRARLGDDAYEVVGDAAPAPAAPEPRRFPAAEPPVAAAPPPASEPVEEPALRVRPAAEELPRKFRARAQAKKNVKEAAAAGIVWAGMAAMVMLTIGAAYVFRVDVVRLWPRTASAYAAVKAPVNPLGLEFEAVGARPALKDGQAALVVSGKIRNVKDRTIESPPLRIQLVDGRGKELAVTIADPENASIPPGESRGFAVDVVNPPLAVENALVTFALDRKVQVKAQAKAARPPEQLHLRGPVGEPVAEAEPAAPGLHGVDPAPIDAQPLPISPVHATPHG